MAKNNPTKKQIDVENRASLKHGPAKKVTEECKVYRYKIDLNYKLQLLASAYQQQSPGKCSVKKCFAKFCCCSNTSNNLARKQILTQS